MNKELVEKARRSFDLNIYETKVWLALLEKGNANIAQVHELSKVPRSRIYDVLKSLENKGFCVEKLGRPVKYLAVEPSLVIERLKRSVEEEGKERIDVLNKLKGTDEYKQLDNLFNTTFIITDKVGMAIKGRTNLLAHLANATKHAGERIVFVSTPKGLERKLNVLLPQLVNKARKGVKVIVGVANGGTEASLPEQLRERLKKENIRVKAIEGDARFCILDKNILLITSSEESKEDTALWLESAFFANTLENLMKK